MDVVEVRSFEEEFAGLYRAAYRAAYRVTGDAEASEDAASEALTRAGLRWRHIGGREIPWVVRVATNLAIDHTRRQSRMVRSGDGEHPIGTTEAIYGEVDLYRALKTLPKRQRQVVVLRYFGDLSERQIADELGMAAGTVKSHASRGLATLRTLLTDTPDIELEPEETR